MPSTAELVVPFVGALQAAFSVLLTIWYGVLAAQFKLLSKKTAQEVSALCVKMLLPALLVVKIGDELQQGTILRYVPVLLWSLTYTFLSVGIGAAATKWFNLPAWVTPAVAFNNTTSLPLLLMQSLESTGILNSILRDGDAASQAISRAQSYFLMNSMVSNSLTFALGPKLLQLSDGDGDDAESDSGDDSNDEEGGDDDEGNDQDLIDEETTLLPRTQVRKANRAGDRAYGTMHKYWERLPPWAQSTLDMAYQFVNAPIIGATIGAIIGLTPALHRLFFNDMGDGGYFNAWLTNSIKNIGDLFASLQIIVVGVKLSQSLRNMKKGEDSGKFGWGTFAFVTSVRFIIWPAISIPFIYLLCSKTGLLSNDPIQWFAMMLMPTGPPAMIMVALSDVAGRPEEQKLAIAKFLTVSYAITPLICFAVVGALKASEAAL